MSNKTFKLQNCFEMNQEVVYPQKNKGYLSWVRSTFKINKNYDVEDFDSDSLRYLKAKTVRYSYNQQAEDMLKALGIDYEITMCKSCGGRTKKLVFKMFDFSNGE